MLFFRLPFQSCFRIKIKNSKHSLRSRSKPCLLRVNAIHHHFHKKYITLIHHPLIQFAIPKMIEQHTEQQLLATLASPISFLIYHILVFVVDAVSIVVAVLNFCRRLLQNHGFGNAQSSYSATEYLIIEVMGDHDEYEFDREDDERITLRQRLSWPSTPRTQEGSENNTRPSLTRSRSLSPKNFSRRMSGRVSWSPQRTPRISNTLTRSSFISSSQRTLSHRSSNSSPERRKLFKRSRSITEQIKLQSSREGFLRYRSV